MKDSCEEQRIIISEHSHYAGRFPAGVEQPIVLKKDGVKHIRRLPNGEGCEEIFSVGLACSECFSGPRLAKLLQPGLEYEQKVMKDLSIGKFASPLSIHTSGGVSEALSDFIRALEPHLPWDNTTGDMDWCLSLQLEGASAVWAAIDMLLQSRDKTYDVAGKKNMVAVGQVSYHGPPSTSFGSRCPLWEKTHQVKYPVPIAGESFDESSYVDKFQMFLDLYEDKVGVILIEPQWGSSQAAFPWPTSLLKKYVDMAKSRGILVMCDEIMCGLGRHGKGESLFVSKALQLDPDAFTFGKAIGGGVYPIAGAVLKKGRDNLCSAGRTVLQSHTYAGSSVRALMTATEVLREIPKWLPSIAKLGEEMGYIFRYLETISDGMLITHGQGLMWGAMLDRSLCDDGRSRLKVTSSLRKYCKEFGILPYIVPCGGFMVTPVIDIDVRTIYEIGQRLEQVVLHTMEDIQWKTKKKTLLQDKNLRNKFLAKKEIRQDYLHGSKSCTSSSQIVSPLVRTRFVL